jgi:hypothetical protein
MRLWSTQVAVLPIGETMMKEGFEKEEHMLYIVVTDRRQKGTCALCQKNLEEGLGYTRNVETTELFCTPACREAYIFGQIIATSTAYVPVLKLIPRIGRKP